MNALSRVAVVGVLVLSACGNGDPGVSASAGRVLDAQVDALRVSAAQDDRRGTSQRLALLRARVEQLVSDQEISESAADRIRSATDAVEEQLALLAEPTTTTSATTTTTLPPAPAEEDPDSKGNRGHKDKDKDEEDDEDRDQGNGRSG